MELPEPDQSWSIMRIVKERCPLSCPTWIPVLNAAEKELIDISRILEKDEAKYGPCFPARKDIFRALELTPLDRVSVVCVGQDPYHNDGQAHGLSFSVPKGVNVPSSLKNIYKELSTSIEGFRMPNHGNLEYWASQGVLLLNQCLTVRPHQPGSHGDLWLGFIMRVVQAVLDRNKNCVFLLLGKEAQRIVKLTGGRGKIVTAVHPSGLSGIFPKINSLFIEDGKPPIDWNVDPPKS